MRAGDDHRLVAAARNSLGARSRSNARALNAEMFFAEAEVVLNAAAMHLGVPIAPAVIAEIVAGRLFSTNAKNPTAAFDNRQRVTRRDDLERTAVPELDAAEEWIGRRADAFEALLAAAALTL